MDKLLIKIADLLEPTLRKSKVIDDSNYSDMDVAIRQVIYNIITMIAFLVFGYIIGCFIEMLVITIVFNILREHSGGYHSWGNLTNCWIVSIIWISMFSLMSKYYNLNILWLIIATFISVIYTFLKAPVLNLEYESYTKNVIQYKFDYLIISLWFIIISMFLPDNIRHSFLFGIISVAPFMSKSLSALLNKIRKKVFNE